MGAAISLKGGHEQKKIIDEFYAKHGNLAIGGGNITKKYLFSARTNNNI